MKAMIRAAGLALSAAIAIAAAPAMAQEQGPSQGNAEHGAYLARAGDCVACHTAPGGKPFAGGLALQSPFGVIHSTNITPDKTHGIGDYSFEEFSRVMRDGVASDGRHLYPAMPYTSYAKTSDQDLRDLYAYFMQDVAAVAEANKPNGLSWPFSMRWTLAAWNMVFHDDRPFKPVDGKDAEWNRGAYLVEGLGHCGTCHTPRGFAYQEKGLDAGDDAYLAGTVLNGSSPINLRGDKGAGLGGWSVDDIVASLKAGRNVHSSVSGPMTEVVGNSTQYLNDGDLRAIAVYLKSLPGGAGSRNLGSDDGAVQKILAGDDSKPGARTFMDSCTACHRTDGKGYERVFPALAGNPMVLGDAPDSLIAIILNGSRLPSTAAAPSDLAMPGFGWRYDDKQIADLATFVRTSWGNAAPAVTAEQVANIRKLMHMASDEPQ